MPDPEPVKPNTTTALAGRKEVTLEKILVPIDFSGYTSAAIDYAVRIGKLAGTHIALLYVVEIPRHQLNPDVYSSSERVRTTFDDLRDKAHARLESLCQQIRTPGMERTENVRVGIPYEEILGESEKIA